MTVLEVFGQYPILSRLLNMLDPISRVVMSRVCKTTFDLFNKNFKFIEACEQRRALVYIDDDLIASYTTSTSNNADNIHKIQIVYRVADSLIYLIAQNGDDLVRYSFTEPFSISLTWHHELLRMIPKVEMFKRFGEPRLKHHR